MNLPYKSRGWHLRQLFGVNSPVVVDDVPVPAPEPDPEPRLSMIVEASPLFGLDEIEEEEVENSRFTSLDRR